MLDSITDSMDINLSKLWEIVEDRGALCAAIPEVAKSQTDFETGQPPQHSPVNSRTGANISGYSPERASSRSLPKRFAESHGKLR